MLFYDQNGQLGQFQGFNNVSHEYRINNIAWSGSINSCSPVSPPQSAAPSNLRLPDEVAGLDAIARTLISTFDQVDIVALGEAHGRFRLDSELRIAMVRHPDFAKKVRFVVVEFGSTTEPRTGRQPWP